jgi:transcriptional regulator with XRE-family HTH domain
MDIYRNLFGKRLRQARKATTLTQSDLAEKLGVEPSTVSRWETGKDFPGDHRLPAICKSLGVELSYFEQQPVKVGEHHAIDYQMPDDVLSQIKKATREAIAEQIGETKNLDDLFQAIKISPARQKLIDLIHTVPEEHLKALTFIVDSRIPTLEALTQEMLKLDQPRQNRKVK